jgi:thiol-disulfide isomerase/thioredoxin
MSDVMRVVCLCAEWCGVCRDYASLFDEAALVFEGRAEFARLDIEDEAELLGPVDVENFPTLLIVRGTRVLFFGTITPHAPTLTRLVQGALAGEFAMQGNSPEIEALAQRVQTALAGRSGP